MRTIVFGVRKLWKSENARTLKTPKSLDQNWRACIGLQKAQIELRTGLQIGIFGVQLNFQWTSNDTQWSPNDSKLVSKNLKWFRSKLKHRTDSQSDFFGLRVVIFRPQRFKKSVFSKFFRTPKKSDSDDESKKQLRKIRFELRRRFQSHSDSEKSNLETDESDSDSKNLEMESLESKNSEN